MEADAVTSRRGSEEGHPAGGVPEAGGSYLLSFNPFAGVVKSLWTTSTPPGQQGEGGDHHEHWQQKKPHGVPDEDGDEEQEELVAVDLEAIPTAVVFGRGGHARSGRVAELQCLKDDSAPQAAAAKQQLTSTEEEAEEEDHSEPTGTAEQDSWMTSARSWLPSLNVQGALASVRSTIKYSIISPQTEETFGKIAALVSQFFADVDVGYSELILGLMLLSICQRKLRETIRTEIPVTRAALEDGYYYMRFAAAVYGWQLIYGYKFEGKANGFFKGLVSGDSINPQIVAAKTGISEEDLITTQWESKDFDPGHYIAYDHSRESIVIAIRGTFHLRDALTDLVASYEAFEEGSAHWYAAQKKLELFEPFLLETLNLYPEYGLVIVGHSLGAGVASLLTILLHNKYPDLHIRCHAYAPPCVVSLDLAKKYRHLITSYVMGDDLVPRLSYGSMEELKSHILLILSQDKSTVARFFKVIAAGNALGKTTTKKLETLLKCDASVNLAELQRRRKELVLPEKLWPPGVVYHMYRLPKKMWSDEARQRERRQELEHQERSHQTPEEAITSMIRENEKLAKAQEAHRKRRQRRRAQDGQEERKASEAGMEASKWNDEHGQGVEKKDELPPRTHSDRKAGQKRYAIEESAPSLFSEVIVSQRMFSDHFPDVYENVLKALIEELEEEDEREEKGEEELGESIGVERDGEGSSNEVLVKKAELMREYSEGKSLLRDQEATGPDEQDAAAEKQDEERS